MSRPARPHGARLLALAAVGIAATGAVLGAAPLASAAPTVASASAAVTGGAFVPVAASRVVDTRSGYGGPKGKLGPHGSVVSSLAGRSGLPAAPGAMSAVVLNLTATNASAATYLTAYAADASVPGTSSLNVPGGATVANLVTVPVSADGRISVANQAGTTDVIADVVGYYATAENASYGGLSPLAPGRLYDSRGNGGPFVSGDTFPAAFSLHDATADADITGVVATVTAVNPSASGYLTAWDGTGTVPQTSSVNFRAGVTTANLVEVKRGDFTEPTTHQVFPGFAINVNVAGSGHVDLLVDILGVYTKPGTGADARFVPLATPQRIVDTRGAQRPNLAPGSTRTFSASTLGSSSTVALAANLTVAGSTSPTYLTTFAHGDARPDVSSINAGKSAVVANAALLEVSPGTTSAGSFDVFNAGGTTPFLVDVAGTFEAPVAPGARAAVSAAPSASLVRGVSH